MDPFDAGLFSVVLGIIASQCSLDVGIILESTFSLRAVARIEKIVHFVQRIFGIHCFRLSSIAFLLGHLLEFLGIIYTDYGNINKWLLLVPSLFWLLCSITILLILLLTELRDEEARIFTDLSKGLSNFRKIAKSEIGGRKGVMTITCLFLAVYFLTTISILLFFAGLVLYLGFLLRACDPLPPSESKVRQWINGLKASFRSPVPAGTSAFRSTNETLFILLETSQTPANKSGFEFLHTTKANGIADNIPR